MYGATSPQGDGRVEVATGDVADRVGHGEHGQAEGQRDAEEADAHVDAGVGVHHLGGQDGGAAAAEDEDEGPEGLRQEPGGGAVCGHDAS
jgi:hypothetical protein